MSTPGWQPLLDAIEAASDPTVRHALQLVADHVVAEVAGDVDGIMATMSADPVYTVWGSSDSVGPVGRDAVRSFYDAMVGTGKNRLDYALTRVVADARAVVTEGDFHHVFSGDVLAGRVEGAEPGRWYHVAFRALVVWVVGPDGRLSGEDIYAGERPRVIREIEPDELPHLGPATRMARI
ncbi:MAG: nuclear transport factor 2 family protein [Sporichthyaceae bacterium]